jgi:hypothetical protein
VAEADALSSSTHATSADTRTTHFMKILGAAVLTSLVLLPARWQPGMTATNDPKTETVVDASGNLRVPGNYRTAYQSLGSWAVAVDQGQGAKEIHVVYASPGTIAAYGKNGHFADGSVLVKEVFEATTGAMTTGTVSHAQALKGWFVLMKDSKNSHPGNKLWGNGWGWSWFDDANPSKTTSTDYKVDCLPCHEPARATDWIYVQGYPSLRR